MRNCRASDSAYSWSNVSPQRGLSVACRICTTDLDGVPDPSGNWRFEGRTARRPRQNVQFLYCSLTVSPMCHLANTEQTRSWVDFHSDSAFCQITLVPVTVTIDHFTSWSFLSFLCFNSSISLRCELNQLILLKCNCRIVTTWQTCSSLAYRDCFYTAQQSPLLKFARSLHPTKLLSRHSHLFLLLMFCGTLFVVWASFVVGLLLSETFSI